MPDYKSGPYVPCQGSLHKENMDSSSFRDYIPSFTTNHQ